MWIFFQVSHFVCLLLWPLGPVCASRPLLKWDGNVWRSNARNKRMSSLYSFDQRCLSHQISFVQVDIAFRYLFVCVGCLILMKSIVNGFPLTDSVLFWAEQPNMYNLSLCYNSLKDLHQPPRQLGKTHIIFNEYKNILTKMKSLSCNILMYKAD